MTPRDFRGSVRGPRGLTRPGRPAGSSGDPQAQGPAGAMNVTVRTHQLLAGVAAGGVYSVSADCEAGERATGGGVLVGNYPGQYAAVVLSAPDQSTGTPTSWHVAVHTEVADGDAYVRAYVLCAAP